MLLLQIFSIRICDVQYIFHSLNQHIPDAYNMPTNILGTGDTTINQNPAVMQFSFFFQKHR